MIFKVFSLFIHKNYKKALFLIKIEKMDIFLRNLKKIDELKDILTICPKEKLDLERCQRLHIKNPIKCENWLKAIILCYRNQAGAFIDYN